MEGQALADVARRRAGADVEEHPAVGVFLPASFTSELIARATSSRGSRSGVRRLFFLSTYQRSASSWLSAVSPLKNSGM
jgi:hypothetical protein